ncbi:MULTISPECIES: DUF1380 family protein [Pectobacterium]|uniref:DUF1380 family protein n=1 Tax=Pectobacterium TaxID=122277 RepID=UPI0013739E77|nr:MULTISPECIES: DUF1380 family protein [Pectobacterium]QHP82862.1 DUF1380 domain-containing protein [Pectobacterium odoriferum]
MYGKVSEICDQLDREFAPDEPIAIMIWTRQDIVEFGVGWGSTDGEAELVLARIGRMSDDERHEYEIGYRFIEDALEAHRSRKISIESRIIMSILGCIDGAATSKRWTLNKTDEHFVTELRNALKG